MKKRVIWNSDERSPDVSCLMNWISTGDNYNRYRGGDQQSGQTQLALAQEIVRSISATGLPIERTAKDVVNKISSIETSFRTASDWLASTRQGIDHECVCLFVCFKLGIVIAFVYAHTRMFSTKSTLDVHTFWMSPRCVMGLKIC